MRKLEIASLALIALAIVPFATAQKQQSVADAARENKKQKLESARTVWTNDNITTVSKGLATEGVEAPPAPAVQAAEAKQDCDKTRDEKCAAGANADADKKKGDELKNQVANLEKSLADQKKEASLNEREWQLSQAAYYGDAGTQLRDPKRFADSQLAHQKETERLQKAIEETQKKIDDLKEQARKDGMKM